MMPASTNGGGNCFAFPDVCKTPAPPAPFVPVPYPNIAQNTQCDAGSCSSKVRITGSKTVVKGTKITMSSGDEGGTAGGGMISSKFKGDAIFKMGSSKVKAEGKQICHLTSMVGQNGGSNANAPAGKQVAPSQVKVRVA